MFEFCVGSFIIIKLLGLASISVIIKKTERDGYRWNNPEKSLIKYILDGIIFLLLNNLPFCNIVLAFCALHVAIDEEWLDELQGYLLDKDIICESEELLAKEKERYASINHEQVRESLDTMDKEISNKYLAMSDAEKLAFLKKERDLILNAGKVEEPVQKVNKK